MKSGRELDATIASSIMGLKAIEPEQIPRYSSDIFSAHNVIIKLQQIGWGCNVGSRIGNDGSLFYRARFFQHGRECERFADTIPMAICSSALSVVNHEYFEYVDILKNLEDDSPIDIIPKQMTGFSKIDSDDEFIEVIKKSLKNYDMSNPDLTVLSKSIINELRKNDYMIIKKPPNIK